jgi:hypothetical protein
MAKSSPPPRRDDDKKIADAEWLLNDGPKAGSKPRPGPKPKAAQEAGKAAPDEDNSYGLAEGHELAAAGDDSPPAPIPGVPKPPRSRGEKLDAGWEEAESDVQTTPRETTEYVDEPAVDQVWSRGAEWGGHLFMMALTATFFGFLVYMAFNAIGFLLSFLIILIGGAVLLVMCYPIFITMERPVRITPEQGAKDYYHMLSHVWPHYPRMWLLLSAEGRNASEFSSFGRFQKYWKANLARLQGSNSSLNHLKFKVEDFRSDKSAGQSAVNAKFTLKVYRGEPGATNIVASYLMSTSLVKGPDRMWYLNSGTLPNERK